MSRKFAIAILGKQECSDKFEFEKVTLESANLLIKEVTVENKSIRLIFLALCKYDSNETKIP